MEIHFRSKEESKQEQQDAFLSLSGSERVEAFIKLSSTVNKLFPSKGNDKEGKNFVIYKGFKNPPVPPQKSPEGKPL
jgi:hypothetical protein